MSYVMAAELQAALYGLLSADAGVSALAEVHDALPPGDEPELYALIGPEQVRDRSDQTGTGAEHELTISILARQPGFGGAKALAAAICDAIGGTPPALARGRIVYLTFHKARAARVETDDRRRIDLIFRARLEDD
ncbi:DUF3168 domain-containing protein [Pseudoroseicyclus sp. CXY001]|uniref:DUF3168 domain-containing protein n=1 Tax=Pseudoroseicyclus sp. CXY001 TaxID=3242492 RepID=UPI00357155F7